MLNLTKKQQMGIVSITIIIVFLLGIKLFNKEEKPEFEEIEIGNIDSSKNEEKSESKEEDIKNIAVYIKGAILNPGLIYCKSGERVQDIVEKAGGFKEEADLDKVNLAKKVQDEETIHIPVMGEVIEETTSVSSSDTVDGSNSESNSKKININMATKEELKSLNGVGDVTADKIIEYREQEKFTSVEDIKNISGIGEKKFEAVKESIEVE